VGKLKDQIEKFQNTTWYKFAHFFGFYKQKENDRQLIEGLLHFMTDTTGRIKEKQKAIESMPQTEDTFAKKQRIAEEIETLALDTTSKVHESEDQIKEKEQTISHPTINK
jgi:hypothetical protein